MRSAPIILISILLLLPITVNGQGPKQSTLVFIAPKQAPVRVGQTTTIQIEVREAKDLFGAPFHLLYDPHLLEVVKVSEGDFLKKDGAKTVFLYKVDKEQGRIIVGLSRLGNAAGISGNGTLVSITFQTLRAGRVVLSFERVDLKDSRQGSLPVRSQTAGIEIR